MVSTVTSGGGLSTSLTCQRKIFNNDEFIFAFYFDNTNIVYKTSDDGETWSDAIIVAPENTSRDASVWFDGTYVYFVWVEDLFGDILHYKRGTISDRIINWGTDYEVHTTPGLQHHGYPFVSCNSNGLPFVSTFQQISSNWAIKVYKCSNGDGSGIWTEYIISDYSDDQDKTSCILPMKNGKMYIVYWSGVFKGKLWNNVAWENEETIGDGNAFFFSCAVDNDIIYFVTQQGPFVEPGEIRYAKRTTEWSVPETVDDTFAHYGSSPLVIPVSNTVYIFWNPLNTNLIYCRTKKNGIWDDRIVWITESNIISGLTSTMKFSHRQIGMLWVTYRVGVRFDFGLYITAYTHLNLKLNKSSINRSIKEESTTLLNG